MSSEEKVLEVAPIRIRVRNGEREMEVSLPGGSFDATGNVHMEPLGKKLLQDAEKFVDAYAAPAVVAAPPGLTEGRIEVLSVGDPARSGYLPALLKQRIAAAGEGRVGVLIRAALTLLDAATMGASTPIEEFENVRRALEFVRNNR